MTNPLTDEVFEQLKGELEAIGVPEHLASRRAARQLESVADEASGETDAVPPQLVVPVSRGWMVIRRFAATEAELFEDCNAAIARARELAAPAGGAVLLLGTDGRVERELG